MKPLEAFRERHASDRQPDAQQRPGAARRRGRSRPVLGVLPDRHPGQEDDRRHQGQHLVRPDHREQDRPRDALRVARTRHGRRAPGRRLRLGLLLRLHEQPGVAKRDAAAAAHPRPARRCSSGCSARASCSVPKRPSAGRTTAAASWTSSSPTRTSCRARSGPPIGASSTSTSTSIREVERQLVKAEKESVAINPGLEKPYGVPPDFAEHFKLMSDMMVIAFQADLTRVMTFMMTREGTSRAYREIGISDGHHPCTHHQGKPDLMEKVTQINEYHTKQLAGFLHKLKVEPGRRLEPARQLDDRLRRRPVGRQPPSARRSADAAHRPRRQLLQAGPPRDLPQGNADVQLPSDADGSDGRADGELRRRDSGRSIRPA